jgi:short-subunit dehydrogenase
MERAIFRGKDEQDAQDRQDLVQKALKTPVLEKPEDVAKAIWEAVKHQHSEVMVGSANVSKTAYNLLPGAMQSVFRKTFSTKDS